MSSIEGLISEIDSEYWKLRNLIESYHKRAQGGSSLSEREAVGLFGHTVKFQRFLESKQTQMKMFSGSSYFGRASAKVSQVLNLITTTEILKTVWTGTNAVRVTGLVHGSKRIVNLTRSGTVSDLQYVLQVMFQVLTDMELELIELFGDIRLMSELLMFPLDQRVRVNDELLRLGFKEAVGFLDEATANLQLDPPHLKDSLANCRHAIESAMYTLAKKDGTKVANRFTVDLSEVSQSNPDIIDDATKAMIQGVYNYLSVKGSHVFGKVEKGNLEEVEFGFDQTYRVLDHVLVRMKALKDLRQSA